MVSIIRLGPASVALPFNGAAIAGDRLVVVTRNITPSMLAVVDIESWDVTATAELPRGTGAWGVVGTGRSVYLGQQQPRGSGANLFRYDLDTSRLSGVAAIDSDVIWDLAAAGDGTVFGVARDLAPFAYDPRSNRARLVGGAPADAEILRSVTVAGSRVVVGGRRQGRALLVSIDPATGRSQPVLPQALAGDRTVYALAAAAQAEVVAATEGSDGGPPAVARIPLADPQAATVVRLEGERLVDAVAVDGEQVYATARPTGSIWLVEDGQVRRLGAAVPNAEHRGLFRHRDGLVGVSAAERVFRMGRDGSGLDVADLAERGLEPAPEVAQSMAAHGGALWVGGNFSLQRVEVASRTRTRTFVPGEPKDMVAVDGGVWFALYPGGEVWWMPVGGDPERVATLPDEHNRPVSLELDTSTGRLVVTVASDRRGTGALCVVDPDGGATTVLPHPFADGSRAPAGLAVDDGVAYVGAARADPVVAAVTLADGRRRWETRVEGAQTMIGLAVTGGRAFGFTPDGWLVVLDAADGRLVRRERVPHPGGRLALAGGVLYGAGRDTLVRIDPAQLTWEVVLDDLDAAYWNHAFLAADTDHVYTLQGHDVVAVPVTGR